jgi:NAD(P)H dehydrogenase (quinone)
MGQLTRREALGGMVAASLLVGELGRAQPSGADKIVISGASGQLGGLAVKWLLDHGVPAPNLILVSRTPEQLADYARLGAATRFGDFTQPQSLRSAYAGGTRMLLISIGFASVPRPEAHRRAIVAAKEAGVRQIAYTSWIGIGHGDTAGIAVDHLATEQILRESAVAWTFLRNSLYMEVLIPAAARIVAQGKAAVPTQEVRIGFVARADCAAAAAAAVSSPGHDNRAFDITGPQLVGVRDVARAARAATGKSIEVTTSDPGTALISGIGGPAAAVTSTAVLDLTGHPPISIDAFFAANRSKLSSRSD